MPDMKVGNQLATAVVHVFPTWGEDRSNGLRAQGLPQVFKEVVEGHQDGKGQKGLKSMKI